MITSNVTSKRIGIVAKDEPATVIKLEDGSVIHIRIIVFACHAIYDKEGKRMFNPDGSPVYGINSQQVMYIEGFESVPEGQKLS